ncbi:MAG: hypothetical protein JJE17_00125 [Peptostreptococcaceae bacterium]|nr:hypothetical protein [Peptostreptococcaceae bacterium]
MSRIYSDYLSVDSDFIPVFSEHSDKEFPNKWKSFYPHESFKTIVSQLIDTLEKGNISKDLPLWMHGAYGTGKTFASFAIKHILEDDLKDVEAYCEVNDMKPLFSRISGVRNKGDILVVHRSSSSAVVGDNKLFNCIIESIKGALLKNNYPYKGGKSQYENILNIIKDTSGSFNFLNVFQKYKQKFEGYESAESIIKDLEDLGVDDCIDLLETIVEVGELEHYTWSTTYTDVINWIEDVKKGNNLYAIVFIWDEFTEFFKNNQNNITGLQEIAHAAAQISFYFFLITHSGTQIINDLNAKRIIEARFKIRPIDMAETTAFKLMGQAIKHEPDLKIEWENVSNELWSNVELTTQKSILLHAKDTTETELKCLLPIHPYAAYLLKVISKEISSNQRTMFQFLSGEPFEGDKERHNFRWFTSKYNSDIGKWNYLTANYIWDYFFTGDNVDLNDAFKSAIAQYDNFNAICHNDEDKQKVLKVALLLSAIQQKNVGSRIQGQSALLRPTLINISNAFSGTPIFSSVGNILNEFTSKGVFSTINDGNDILYVPPVNNIDQERFEKMLEENKKNITFEKILTDTSNGIDEQFLPNDYLKYRYRIFLITTNNYKAAQEIAKNLESFQIPLFFIFALNEIDQGKCGEIIEKLLKDIMRKGALVDFSATPLSGAFYEKYLQSKTEERYYGDQTNQGKLAKQNAERVIKEWKNKLFVTNLDFYPKVDGQVTKVQGGGNLRKRLKELNSNWFGCGLEEISINDKLFAPTGFKETVAQMAMNRLAIASSFSYLNQIATKLTNEQIWANVDYCSTSPNHVVSRMKKCVNETVKRSFEKNSMVAITDIWEALQEPPFGLFSCTGSVFLIGFLLKEYADGNFYKYDGANTVALNHTDLSDLIFSAVKGLPKSKNQFIVKQKPEHIEFCKISGAVFRIAKDKQNSIQDIAKNISVFLKNNENSLWSLKYYVEIEFEEEELCEQIIATIALYCELVSTNRMAGRDITKVAEELYVLYKKTAGLDRIMEDIVHVENMKAGMIYYIAQYKPELIQVIKRLDLSEQDLLIALNKKLSADASYLWDIGDTNKQIDNLYEDYLLIDVINNIVSGKQFSFEGSISAIEKKLNNIKIPEIMILDDRIDLKDILKSLCVIKNRTIVNKDDLIEKINLGTDIFNVFFANQQDIFKKIVKKYIPNISGDELLYLYQNIEPKTFFVTPDEFILMLNNKLKNYRKDQKINKLFLLWKDRTSSNSPDTWSRTNRISILCLFENEFDSAQIAFDLINGTRKPQSENEIDESISFISGQSLDILSDLKKCNEIFINNFCGEYAYIINDVEELKNMLVSAMGNETYKWINNRTALSKCVEQLSLEKYRTIYKEKVIEKICNLTPSESQKLLADLIDDKPLVGINILKL